MIYSLKGVENISKQFQQIAQSKGSQACWSVWHPQYSRLCSQNRFYNDSGLQCLLLVALSCCISQGEFLNMTKPDTVTCYKPADTTVHKLLEWLSETQTSPPCWPPQLQFGLSRMYQPPSPSLTAENSRICYTKPNLAHSRSLSFNLLLLTPSGYLLLSHSTHTPKCDSLILMYWDHGFLSFRVLSSFSSSFAAPLLILLATVHPHPAFTHPSSPMYLSSDQYCTSPCTELSHTSLGSRMLALPLSRPPLHPLTLELFIGTHTCTSH